MMNKQELAKQVYKHYLIQEIMVRKIAEPSLINQLIVQEVLNEAPKLSPLEILQKTVEKLENSTDEQIKTYVNNRENKTQLNGILKALEDVGGIESPYSGLTEEEVKTLRRLVTAVEQSSSEGGNADSLKDVISTWVKGEIAKKAAVPLEKFLARVPVIGAMTGVMQVLGVKVEEEAIKTLLFPIDIAIDEFWKTTGAEELEETLQDFVGEGAYAKIINANTNEERVSILKSLSYKEIMNNLIKMLRESKNPKVQEKFNEVLNFEIKGFAVGRAVIRAIVGDDLEELLPPDDSTDSDTNQTKPATSFYSELAQLEEKNEIYDGAVKAFQKLENLLIQGSLVEFQGGDNYDKLKSSLSTELQTNLDGAMNQLGDSERKLILAVLSDEKMRNLFANYIINKIKNKKEKPEQDKRIDKDPETTTSIDELPDDLKADFAEIFNSYKDAKERFTKYFLRVPFLYQQQRILMALLDSLDEIQKESAALSRERVTEDKEEKKSNEVKIDKITTRKLRYDLRYIESKIRSINSKIKDFVNVTATRIDSSEAKEKLVSELISLQDYISQTYEDTKNISLNLKESEETPELSKEDKIDMIEDAYDSINPIIRSIDIELKEKGDFRRISSYVDKIRIEIDKIKEFFPKTATFQPEAKKGSVKALKLFDEAIKQFRADYLIDVYNDLKDGVVSKRQLAKIQQELLEISFKMQEYLGVTSKISDSEVKIDKSEESIIPVEVEELSDEELDQILPPTENQIDSDLPSKDGLDTTLGLDQEDPKKSTTYDVSYLNELTTEEQDAVSEFLERLNKKINKDAPEGAKSSQDEFIPEAIDVKDFAKISEKYSEKLINQIINEMGEQGQIVLKALGKLENVDVLFKDEFELSPDEFPEDEKTKITKKPSKPDSVLEPEASEMPMAWKKKGVTPKEAAAAIKFLNALDPNLLKGPWKPYQIEWDQEDLSQKEKYENWFQYNKYGNLGTRKAARFLSKEEWLLFNDYLRKFDKEEELELNFPSEEFFNKNYYKFRGEKELASFLWNAGSDQRIEKIRSIVRKLDDYIDQEYLYWLDNDNKYKEIKKVEVDNKSIKFYYEEDDNFVFVDSIPMDNPEKLKKMFTKVHLMFNDEQVPLMYWISKDRSFVTKLLKKTLGNDTPLEEQLANKLEPIIEQMLRGRDG